MARRAAFKALLLGTALGGLGYDALVCGTAAAQEIAAQEISREIAGVDAGAHFEVDAAVSVDATTHRSGVEGSDSKARGLRAPVARNVGKPTLPPTVSASLAKSASQFPQDEHGVQRRGTQPLHHGAQPPGIEKSGVFRFDPAKVKPALAMDVPAQDLGPWALTKRRSLSSPSGSMFSSRRLSTGSKRRGPVMPDKDSSPYSSTPVRHSSAGTKAHSSLDRSKSGQVTSGEVKLGLHPLQ